MLLNYTENLSNLIYIKEMYELEMLTCFVNPIVGIAWVLGAKMIEAEESHFMKIKNYSIAWLNSSTKLRVAVKIHLLFKMFFYNQYIVSSVQTSMGDKFFFSVTD